MMRFMLHENHLEKISMDKEIEYIKNYIALQQLRIVSSPQISIETVFAERSCNALIAPMLLIPFVENAFKHGISLQERSWIKLSLRCDEHTLYFDINNSLHIRQHADTEKDRSGIGLENVRQRLNLAYPGRYELHIHQNTIEHFVHLTIQF
jgi:LytS/YehU family sensor histidine kinase